MTAAATVIGLTMGGRTYTVEDVAHIGPEYETVRCQVPDEKWSATDAGGHEHRYWQPAAGGDLALPTLTRSERHVDCDGDGMHTEEFCEGYTQVYWTCIVCGDEVVPGSRTGSRSFKSRESYTEVTTTIDPAELADEAGSYTIPPRGERHDDAHLVWPAGPGRMLDIRGQAWEIDETWWAIGNGPTRVSQKWAVSERTP